MENLFGVRRIGGRQRRVMDQRGDEPNNDGADTRISSFRAVHKCKRISDGIADHVLRVRGNHPWPCLSPGDNSASPIGSLGDRVMRLSGLLGS